MAGNGNGNQGKYNKYKELYLYLLNLVVDNIPSFKTKMKDLGDALKQGLMEVDDDISQDPKIPSSKRSLLIVYLQSLGLAGDKIRDWVRSAASLPGYVSGEGYTAGVAPTGGLVQDPTVWVDPNVDGGFDDDNVGVLDLQGEGTNFWGKPNPGGGLFFR